MNKTADKCTTCGRDPKRMNSEVAECSHLECPTRRRAWSERPTPTHKGPWLKNESLDPEPLDRAIEKGELR